jgi:hypothetical protein
MNGYQIVCEAISAERLLMTGPIGKYRSALRQSVKKFLPKKTAFVLNRRVSNIGKPIKKIEVGPRLISKTTQEVDPNEFKRLAAE